MRRGFSKGVVRDDADDVDLAVLSLAREGTRGGETICPITPPPHSPAFFRPIPCCKQSPQLHQSSRTQQHTFRPPPRRSHLHHQRPTSNAQIYLLITYPPTPRTLSSLRRASHSPPLAQAHLSNPVLPSFRRRSQRGNRGLLPSHHAARRHGSRRDRSRGQHLLFPRCMLAWLRRGLHSRRDHISLLFCSHFRDWPCALPGFFRLRGRPGSIWSSGLTSPE